MGTVYTYRLQGRKGATIMISLGSSQLNRTLNTFHIFMHNGNAHRIVLCKQSESVPSSVV